MAAKSNGNPAARSLLESFIGFCCCSMKFIPGAVPFGPMSVDVVTPVGAVVVTVVSVVSTDEDYVGPIPLLCS
jgi:hypothetical protein